MPKEREIICGPMNSGKSKELIRRITREEIAGRHVIIFKPEIDDRTENEVASRDGDRLPAIVTSSPQDFLQKVEQIHARFSKDSFVIGIDEVQFFNRSIVGVVRHITQDLNIKVIISGLSRDFRGEPFGPMPKLLAMSGDITTLTAICTHRDAVTGKICGGQATETYREIEGEPADFNDPIILVGDKKEGYGSRCSNHHKVKNQPPSLDYPQKNTD